MKNYLLRLLAPSTEHKDLVAAAANAMEELAEDLEEAIYSQDRAEIDDLSRELMGISSSLIRNLPSQAKAIISGNMHKPSEFDRLYIIGQLAFAQHLAAVIASKRPQKDFMDILESNWATPYLDALYDRDLSSSQLAEAIGAQKETVSRNLRKLREAGIADFKKKGALTINFLTNAATEVWSAVLSEKPTTKIEELRSARFKIEDGTSHQQTTDAVENMLNSITGKKVSPHLSHMPTMDAPL